MANRRHADTGVTRRLWDEVCRNLFPRRESLHPQQQSKLVGKVRKRWRSLRDRFKREFNDEMKAPSGSAGRKRSKYKYGQALSFLRRTMLSRVTFSSHRAPASSSAPSGAIPPESATEGHVGRGGFESKGEECGNTEDDDEEMLEPSWHEHGGTQLSRLSEEEDKEFTLCYYLMCLNSEKNTSDTITEARPVKEFN
ncbi:uncharacterized protein LOC143767761 [Ranitomeya variabilis]|uniref:uncharacterized protein LOC143767761 n=1 Tax=Ranitomeya variabilis TaxID=490064 RepID=UPI0040561071